MLSGKTTSFCTASQRMPAFEKRVFTGGKDSKDGPIPAKRRQLHRLRNRMRRTTAKRPIALRWALLWPPVCARACALSGAMAEGRRCRRDNAHAERGACQALYALPQQQPPAVAATVATSSVAITNFHTASGPLNTAWHRYGHRRAGVCHRGRARAPVAGCRDVFPF